LINNYCKDTLNKWEWVKYFDFTAFWRKIAAKPIDFRGNYR